MTSEEYDKLTDEEKRIKVAELCGWTEPPKRHWPTFMRGPDSICGDIPDYLNDLNACHEFELGMDTADYLVYVNCHLSQVSGHEENGRIVSATAAQRCKAFVLTMTGGK